MFRYLVYCVLVVFSSSVFAQNQLIFAIDLIRHGDRTPLAASPAMQKMFPEGPGQLTPRGMRQEYELGQYLRRTYIDANQLLPKKYDIKTMTVRSSGTPRTMMSAQALLLGLYPMGTGPYLRNATPALPKALQPIPINTLPREIDSLLIPGHNQKERQELLQKYIINTKPWLAKERELSSNYSRWSEIFGVRVVSLHDVVALSDRLFIEKLYNIPPPRSLSAKDINLIMSSSNWTITYIANNHKLAIAYGKEFAHKVRDEFKATVTEKRTLKYMLFVAHDTTLEAQMNLLQQEITELPPYASRLNYSLYNKGSEYVVKVSLNNKPLSIKACGGDTCSLTKFIQLLNDTTKLNT